MPDSILTIILAGGVGSRLQPLTTNRAKPAVPFGGKYRIIDFTLTNCLHSGLRRILVLTQYKSHSLQKHLRDGWSIFNPELGEYVTTIPPQMRQGEGWYAGTADAIHQNLYLVERSGAKQVVILSGDHIYRMDYAAMLKTHAENSADVVVGCMEVGLDEARHFGVMRVDESQRIVAFDEKPENPACIPGKAGNALVSMGIYVFSTDLLIEVIRADHADANSSHDFGKDLLPKLIRTQRVFAHHFGGAEGRVTPDRYWRDVGTIDAYYAANMDLLKPIPPLNLYQSDWPIRTYARQHPPGRTVPGELGNEGLFINSIIAGGTVIAGGSVQHSILFADVYVGDEALVENSLLFDEVHVGDGAMLRNCIVDKRVAIPAREKIGYDAKKDRQRFTISDAGIVVVPQGYLFN